MQSRRAPPPKSLIEHIAFCLPLPHALPIPASSLPAPRPSFLAPSLVVPCARGFTPSAQRPITRARPVTPARLDNARPHSRHHDGARKAGAQAGEAVKRANANARDTADKGSKN